MAPFPDYKTSILFCILLPGVFISCKKQEIDPPAWFSQHTTFYYDYSDDSSNVPDFRRLTVYASPGENELFFEELPVDTGVKSWWKYFGIFGNGTLKRKSDGLYDQACQECGVGLICNPFDFLSIPANPVQAAEIQQYECAYGDAGKNIILSPDTVINVPAGRFNTFAMLHANKDVSYWDRDIGLIMYELYQHDRAFPLRKLATLKLNRMR